MLCRLTRRSVTVGISGDGGDELFGGYGRYRAAPERWDRVRQAPRPLRRAASRAMSLLDGRSARPARRLRKLLAPYAATDVGRFYRDHRSLWRDGDGIVPAPGIPAFDSVFGPAPMPSLAERFMLTDALTYLPDALLTKIDRASMAASLEARAPLLDYRIAEFSWSLPLALKIRNGEGKWLLRQVLYRRVPRELVERPKMGFEAPVGRWLRQGLRDWAEELLNDRRLAEHGLLAPRSVRARWREHRQGRRNWTYPLWTVLMLHAWLEKETSDRGGAAEPPRPKG